MITMSKPRVAIPVTDGDLYDLIGRAEVRAQDNADDYWPRSVTFLRSLVGLYRVTPQQKEWIEQLQWRLGVSND